MISIIIPIYNAERYLKQCLDSLVAQTFHDWEAILVDDDSTDGSADIASRYVEYDFRFRLIRLKENKGQAAARNRGLSDAQGDFLTFMDADDWWDENFLEYHMSHIGNCDYTQSGYRRMHEEKVLEEEVPRCKWRFTTVWGRLYRWKAIEGLRFVEGMYYEDIPWSVELWKRRPRVAMLPYIGYNYRVHTQSTTARQHPADQLRVIQLLRGWHPAVIYTKIRLKMYWKRQKS